MSFFSNVQVFKPLVTMVLVYRNIGRLLFGITCNFPLEKEEYFFVLVRRSVRPFYGYHF